MCAQREPCQKWAIFSKGPNHKQRIFQTFDKTMGFLSKTGKYKDVLMNLS